MDAVLFQNLNFALKIDKYLANDHVENEILIYVNIHLFSVYLPFSESQLQINLFSEKGF
jgi:hypothetical protein